ncbi:bud site selection-related protein [Lichtheimia corymbifera JMRC:FSU:9682]|uniref:Bud site selection-related protein n=2 Tax=Lichtheimia TaxID=688353 RepID=A0A068S9Z6_9FUNG|nr:bud site selection-related protein [Lichtheimia corymbifera JMRC:FSU:9682]CDS06081.1 hypothetical protein LRAMOSA08609 [Lichtheimia ramosa]
MGRLRRSRTHHSIRDTYRKYRTRNYTRDLDQIHDDIKPENAQKLKNQPLDPDKPGLGQNYCIECARHFITEAAFKEHIRGKLHKKRLKQLKEEPYTQAEADAAAGLGKPDNGKRGGRSLVSEDVAMADD